MASLHSDIIPNLPTTRLYGKTLRSLAYPFIFNKDTDKTSDQEQNELNPDFWPVVGKFYPILDETGRF
jgi:hypothetical protein